MQTLTSNKLPAYDDSSCFTPLRDSTPLLSDPEALRTRFDEDGYLHLCGVLDPVEIHALRADYFSRFDPAYLAPGTAPVDGVFSGAAPAGLPRHGTPGHPAYGFARSARFMRFTENPALAQLAEILLAGPATLLPRRIVRHFNRKAATATRAHRDIDYFDRGADRLVTMWIPLGDCTPGSGGLIYLEGSHRLGAEQIEPLRKVTDRPHDRRPISHDLSWVSSRLGLRWTYGACRAGDLILHSARLIHASLDVTGDMMRLSTDLRFARRGDPIDPRWMMPWSGDDGY